MSRMRDQERPDPPEEPAETAADEGSEPRGRPTGEQMGEWSFPASDPPATWTWEPRSP